MQQTNKNEEELKSLLPLVCIRPRQFNEQEVQDYLNRLKERKENEEVQEFSYPTPLMLYGIFLNYYEKIYEEVVMQKKDKIFFLINDTNTEFVPYDMLEVMTYIKHDLEYGNMQIKRGKDK